MDSFDIGRLTDFDFESICKDLFEEILERQLEIFAPGPDQGIDLRHLKEHSEAATIIQCKHWMRTGRAKLLGHMRAMELPKVRHLNPTRYILASSVEMTARAKDDLIREFAPHIKSTGDIYGLHEIESELRKRPHIVQRHPRLWLNSTAILQGVLGKEVLIRSSALVDELQESLKVYVPNDSLPRAKQLLDTQHVVVVSGIPGIGKTTLAQVLIAEYSARGFEIVEISEDVEEANRLWMDGKRQVFYYDDFLGQTTLEDKLNKNEDSRLLSLLRRINADSGKRFILTTREYILNQARQRYEKISHADFSPMTCVLDLGDYTRQIRAQILYNHVYFSGLPYENRAKFAEPDVYRPIINHPNFNPRLVRLSLEPRFAPESPDETPRRLIANLKKPRRIWQHVVENQLDDGSVSLLEVLFSLGPASPYEALKNAWLTYKPSLASDGQLRRALGVLEGTLVRIILQGEQRLIDFHNPSVRDYLREYLSDRPDVVGDLVSRAFYFEQIQTLWAISSGPGGDRISSALLARPEVLCASVERTMGSAHPRTQWGRGLLGRVSSALQVAERLQSLKLCSVIEELLDGIDFVREANDGEEVTSLIYDLFHSQFESMNRWAIALIDEAIEYIMADTSDWSNLEHAESLISNLEHIDEPVISEAVSRARQRVDDDMHEAANDAFGRWSEYSGEGWRNSASEMVQIVEFASRYNDPEDLFPTYRSTVEEVERIQEESREVNKLSTPDAIYDESASVWSILGALRERSE